jgi:hypothetical protein
MDKKLDTLYALCEALFEELEDYKKKIEKSDGMSAGDLEAVDKLSHALKSIKTTVAMMESQEEDGYSGHYMPYWGGMAYAQGDNRGGSSNARGGNPNTRGGGNSNARGRGGNVRRDSMGRYSGNDGYSYTDEFESAIHEAMSVAPDERMREKLKRIMDEM